jgi:hypothetical protein
MATRGIIALALVTLCRGETPISDLRPVRTIAIDWRVLFPTQPAGVVATNVRMRRGVLTA